MLSSTSVGRVERYPVSMRTSSSGKTKKRASSPAKSRGGDARLRVELSVLQRSYGSYTTDDLSRQTREQGGVALELAEHADLYEIRVRRRREHRQRFRRRG